MSDTPNPSVPLEDVKQEDLIYNLGTLLSQRLFGGRNYEQISETNQSIIRYQLQDFQRIAGDLGGIIQNLENDTITASQDRALRFLIKDENLKEAFIAEYRDLLEDNYVGDTLFEDKSYSSSRNAEIEAYKLYEVLDKYKQYSLRKEAERTAGLEYEDLIQEQLDQMGDFKSADFYNVIEGINTTRRIGENLNIRGRKFRADNPPSPIDKWRCRIGASTFYVPPTSIDVYQNFSTTSLAGAALRQPNSPKINMGHSQTMVSVTLYFPTHETIWGFDGDEAEFKFHEWDPQNSFMEQEGGDLVSDRVIDKYLSSLRGLITQFKYSPFLPIKNEYVNRAHDIDAVALKNMTVSTVEGFPFVAAVTLEMSKFNYNPFMPMIQHFDQAIHWGKFRQHASRGAMALDRKTNKGFLVEKIATRGDYTTGYEPISFETKYENEYTGTISKLRDIDEGKNFDFFYPITTPSKIFTGDDTDFRQPGEDEFFTADYWGVLLEDLGLQPTQAPNFLFSEYDTRRNIFTSERNILLRWLKVNTNTWQQMNSDKFEQFIQEKISQAQQESAGYDIDIAAYEARLRAEWFYVLFDDILTNDPYFEQIRERREIEENDYILKEWEIPMAKANIDWSSCIVKGVGVSLSNRFADLQVQLQDEPTMQHIGGGDSMVEVEMVVLGQENIIAFRRMFQHINGLGRLEREHGVLGFLGIKNIFTALCGIKYVLPISFEVETVPSYPDVYSVRMSFVDFDVMQQKRENVSSEVQKDLIENYGKRNPFFRIKQSWGSVNLYPDFPLGIYDDDDRTIGHLDPDWYFRSFVKNNDDLINWGVSQKAANLLREYSSLISIDQTSQSQAIDIALALREIRNELIEISKSADDGILPPGWRVENGEIEAIEDNEAYQESKREYRYYLGVHGESQTKIAILDMFPGGYFRIGDLDKETNVVDYSTDYSALSEDLASNNMKGQVPIDGNVALPDYQNEYMEGEKNPNRQYESIMQDWDYRNVEGRMIKAFPTYMLWLIDEGGRFAGIKLFDNLYGLNSIIDFSVVNSGDNPLADTLVLRLSNVYEKLTRSYSESILSEDDPIINDPIGKSIQVLQNRKENFESGLYDSLVQLGNIRLKPGIRIHLRAGYSSNPNALDTIFNGTIMEVQAGQIMTVVAQSDAVELSGYVNSTSQNDHTGKIDGGLNNLWLSEPRDLMVRLLSMGSSNFKEWLSWGTKGVIFSESRFGIRHFGNMLYEPMTKSEVIGNFNKQSNTHAELQKDRITSDGGFGPILGDSLKQITELTDISNLGLGTVASAHQAPALLASLSYKMLINSFGKRDYEVFKRNIYPGNGSGVAQFMGGDMLDAGIMLTQAGTVYDQDQVEGKDALDQDSSPSNEQDPNSGGSDQPTSNVNVISDEQSTDNTNTINQYWNRYYDESGIDRDELILLLSDPNSNAADIAGDLSVEEDLGLLTALLSPVTEPFSYGFREGFEILKGSIPIAIDLGLTVAAPLAPFRVSKMWTGLGVFANSPVGLALGLGQVVTDDDLAGFNEVSFRAQTYMKTIWDLCQVCAALLPNYIVAVRPFEDRSTLFYGKPHWLYTSGLIPVTTGVQTSASDLGNLGRDLESRPKFDKTDSGVSEMLGIASNFDEEVDRMFKVGQASKNLKSPDSFLLNNLDPYEVTSAINGKSIASVEDLKAIFGGILETQIEREENEQESFDALEFFSSTDYGSLTIGELQDLADLTGQVLDASDSGLGIFELYSTDDVREYVNDEDADKLVEAINNFNETYVTGGDNLQNSYDEMIDVYIGSRRKVIQSGEKNFDKLDRFDKVLEEIKKDKNNSGDSGEALIRGFKSDPVTFAYQFGWRYSNIPVYIGAEVNGGYDVVGEIARKYYNEEASPTQDVLAAEAGNEGRNDDRAYDIWIDFRKTWRYTEQVQDDFIRFFPEEDELARFDEFVDLFIQFLWQDPFNRAWLILRPDKFQESAVATLNDTFNLAERGRNKWFNGDDKDFKGIDFETGKPKSIGVGDEKWMFYPNVGGAWQTFLASGDVQVNPSTGKVVSGATRAWMRQNAQQGSDSGNVITGAFESAQDWYDSNINQVLSLVIDSVTGLLATVRMSLSQLSNSLSQSGQFQRQANALNKALDDSIYYQLGERGDLLRAVDNPFTREYGEPVIEIREPFQRVHMISSFDSILSNGIMENLDDVATTITTLSDGKNPVTTHLDKGIPPDRQIEKTVESGIYFDNVVGSGFFGLFQPLISPLEAIRGVKKNFTNSSDELTARRIGLYHLKNSVKNIYQGEIVILGNTSIRPHDLLYISDNYNRMFGMVEVAQVTHHFTPETGFITSIIPNALVTINDPARWTMTSYLWNKLTNYAMRDEMRALMGISNERFIASAGNTYRDSQTGDLIIPEEDLYNQFSDQIAGAVQWTQGNTAIVRDLGAVFAGGGIDGIRQRDNKANKIVQLDLGIKALTSGGKLASGIGGGLIGAAGSPVAGAAVGLAGYAINDILWNAWQWIKDNLLDQQGCYIQFLNKDGQAMDAGLSYFQGNAVGSNHMLSLFPNVFGIKSPKQDVKRDGNYRITTNDLLDRLGWTEVETTALHRDISLYVDRANAAVLDLAGRGANPVATTNDDYEVTICRVIEPNGGETGEFDENGDPIRRTGVIDGDTLWVKALDVEQNDANTSHTPGEVFRVRLSSVNTPELLYKNNADTDFDEIVGNEESDLGRLAQEYLAARFAGEDYKRIVAIRVKKSEMKDDYGRSIGTIFHNTPAGTDPANVAEVLFRFANSNPPISWDSYLQDGRPYTLNWELVMTGFGNVDMRDSLWETNWRDEALDGF